MPDVTSTLEEAIFGIDRLRALLSKKLTLQVGAVEDRSLIKATAFAWFKSQRPSLDALHEIPLLKALDGAFQELLEFSARSTTRIRYRDHLRDLKANLVKLRSQAVLLENAGQVASTQQETSPAFSRVVSDNRMREILLRRWEETRICKDAGAHLAATVMMGALLEALLLARVNRLPDKSPVFRSKSAPLDRKTKQPLLLKEWTLKNYIDVAHELNWIRQSARDVGIVLRDYRNYIHPEKEFTHGVSLNEKDTRMFWVIFLSLMDQITDVP